MSSSNAFGKGAFRIQERISARRQPRRDTFRVEAAKPLLDARFEPLADRNSRNAWGGGEPPEPGSRP